MEKIKTTGTTNCGLWLTRFVLPLVLAVFYCLTPLYGADSQRPPIDINLIIDGSQAFSDSREEIASWICSRLDQILADGDRVTIWSAGASAKVVYSGSINSNADSEAAKKIVRELSASGNSVDFAGALKEAASRQSSSYSYTLLISASQEALSYILSSSNANLLRFSRIEEFSSWRALVVGLNLETRVRAAASAFYGS